MSKELTGSAVPLNCRDIQALPRRSDICYACLGGTFCDENDQNCKDLNGCSINGTQQCGFFYRCQEDATLTIRENSRTQFVTNCQLDGLRIALFVTGLFITIVFLYLGVPVARA